VIEPTDEMLAAFLAAWDRENRIINESAGEYVETGARDRAGLAAALAIVERNYYVVGPRPQWKPDARTHLMPDWAEATLCCGRPPDELPHGERFTHLRAHLTCRGAR